ncbi:MAG: energy transducer TonB [Acidobacteriota bacterium]|nr:energy transducer TonB [Acidobacteriota bacterium]
MRWVVVALMAAFTILSQAQPAKPEVDTFPPGEQVTAYTASSGIVPPELLPQTINIPHLNKCKGKLSGKVMLDIIVDSTGAVRNSMFAKPVGNELDRLALQIVDTDHFKPGTLDGKPVAVAERMEVKLTGCEVSQPTLNGKTIPAIALRELPTQQPYPAIGPASKVRLATRVSSLSLASGTVPLARVGQGVTPPSLLFAPEAKYTDEARERRINAKCLFSIIVDTEGLPQAPMLLHGIGYGLDANALTTVLDYRFKPAMRDGEPVPMRIIIEVNFKIIP